MKTQRPKHTLTALTTLMFVGMLSVSSVMLSACTSTAPSNAPVDTSFRDMPALSLNVGTLNLTSTAPNVAPQTGGYGINITPPAVAFENYARKRLKANGHAGFLTIDIQQAALTAQALPPSGNWTDKFALGAPTEYTVNLRIGAVLSGTGSPEIKSAFTLERKATVPANAAVALREHEVNALIAETIYDMDAALTAALRDTMHIVNSEGLHLPSHAATPFPSLPAPHQIGAPTPLR